MAKPPTNQNRHNRPENRSLKSRQFKGVRMRKWGKWVSEIRMPNSRSRIWLGSYETPEKAARAYDFAVYCLKGSKAKFNFPESPPEIPCASSLSPPQIQAAASKFAAQEFLLPLEDNLASSFFSSEAESGIERQWISVEQGTELWDSILEDLDNCESVPLLDLSESPPEIPCASSLFPPQIQSAAPKFAAEEFWLPLEDDAASSSSRSEAESGIERQWISVEQGTAIWDSVLEDMGNQESIPFKDFTHLHISMEDTDILFQHTDNWGAGRF